MRERQLKPTILFSIGALATLALAAAAATLQGQSIAFVDRSAEWGVGAYLPEDGHGSGLAAADYDDDGDVDLFVPQAAGTPDRLYRNTGAGAFEEIAATVGLASSASSRVALWFDADADGRLDLIVANDDLEAASSFHFYRQQLDGTFTDATTAAGLALAPIIINPNHHWAGICAGDLDGDGDLDLFTGQWRGPGRLLRNDGDGTFTDDSAAAGVDVDLHHHQCAIEDFDADGRMDIHVAIDFDANRLWRNQGDGTFVDVAPAWGLANAWNDMGVAPGDFDGDGDFDYYVTNIWLPDQVPPRHNILLRADGTPGSPAFTEVSAAMGVDQGYFGWGATFLDGDLDGDLDLAATNGWRSGGFETDPSRYFESPGGALPFVDASSAVGFDDTRWGSSLLAADLDRDGDLDLIQGCMDGDLRILENEPADGGEPAHWLVVRPRASGANRHATGARVRVLAGGTWMLRRLAAGTSYMGQEPFEAHFGLGASSAATTVEIRWPDGIVTAFGPVAADQVWTVDLVFADGFETGTTRWSGPL